MSAYKLIEVVKTAEKENQSMYDREDIKTASDDMHNDFGIALKALSTLACYSSIIDNQTGEAVESLYWANYAPDVNSTIKERVYTHNDYQEDNISSYESEQIAIGNFHTKWATVSKKTECKSAIVVRIDGTGKTVDTMVKNVDNY